MTICTNIYIPIYIGKNTDHAVADSIFAGCKGFANKTSLILHTLN